MTNLFTDIHEYLKEFLKDTGTKLVIKPTADHIVVGLVRSKIDDEFDYSLFGEDDLIATTCIYYDEMVPKMISPYVGNRVIKMWNEYKDPECHRNCDWCAYRTSEGCEAASLVRCKDCRFFCPVCITDKTIKVCIKGHNGYETFGCTEGEPENVQD